MEFTHDVESDLIALVEVRPCLWNSKDVHYHNRHVKEMAMKEITEHLGAGFTEAMVKSKWANLRSQFQREVRKIKESAQGGHPLDRYVPKWAHYQQMQFLRQDDCSEGGCQSIELLPDISMDHSMETHENDSSQAGTSGQTMPSVCVSLKRKCFFDNGTALGGAGASASSSNPGSRYRREVPLEEQGNLRAAMPTVGACRAFGVMMESCVSEIPEGPNRDLAMLVAYQALVRFKLTLNGRSSDTVDVTLSELFRS